MEKDTKILLIKLFEDWSGEKARSYVALPLSGSYRRYYRILGREKSAIGTFNADRKENIAFLEMSKHFRGKGLPVPEIYAEELDDNVYLQEDLGDTSLYARKTYPISSATCCSTQ